MSQSIYIIIAVVLLGGFFIMRSAKATGTGTISPAEVQKKMEQGDEMLLVDVRTAAEYEEGHIPGAILIPVDIIGETAEKKLPDKNREIIVYCRSGARAGTAAKVLAGMGYKNVRNLGGIINWPYEIVRD